MYSGQYTVDVAPKFQKTENKKNTKTKHITPLHEDENATEVHQLPFISGELQSE